MWWEKLYPILGLDPLDEFMAHKWQVNTQRGVSPTDQYRGIGTTTWMVAGAIEHLLHGSKPNARNAVIVEIDHQRCELVSRRFRQLAPKILRFKTETVGANEIILMNGTRMMWAMQSAYDRNPRIYAGCELFHGERWIERVIRRMKGPYAMIQEIRKVGDEYHAYAEDDEFLMTVPTSEIGGYRSQGMPILGDMQLPGLPSLEDDWDFTPMLPPKVVPQASPPATPALHLPVHTLPPPVQLGAPTTRTPGWLNAASGSKPVYVGPPRDRRGVFLEPMDIGDLDEWD